MEQNNVHYVYTALASVAGGWSPSSTGSPRRFWGGAVEEIPDEDSVIVGRWHDLELVKLESEYSAGMFPHKSSKT